MSWVVCLVVVVVELREKGQTSAKQQPGRSRTPCGVDRGTVSVTVVGWRLRLMLFGRVRWAMFNLSVVVVGDGILLAGLQDKYHGVQTGAFRDLYVP